MNPQRHTHHTISLALITLAILTTNASAQPNVITNANQTDQHTRLANEISAWQETGGFIDLLTITQADPNNSSTPTSPNPADIYRSLEPDLDRFQGAAAEEEGTYDLDLDPSIYPDEVPLKILQDAILEFTPTLQSIKEATQMGIPKWGLDYEQERWVGIAHHTLIMKCLHLLTAEAFYYYRTDQNAAAAQTLITGLDLAQQIGAEPMMWPHGTKGTVSQSLFNRATDFCTIDPEFVSVPLRQRIDAIDHYAGYRRAVQGEVARQLGELRKKRFGNFSLPMTDQQIDETLAGEIADYLNATRAFLEQAAKPLFQHDAALAMPQPPASWQLEPDFAGNQNTSINHHLEFLNAFEANRQVILTCLRLREYKITHGEYPDPKTKTFTLPIDPVDGNPIIYQLLSPEGPAIIRASSRKKSDWIDGQQPKYYEIRIP